MKNHFLAFIFLCVTSLSFAQHPVSIHLTQKDGLPDIEFYDMIEDDKGFMWFACNNGLYRYDGKEFKNYSHPKKRGLSVFNLKFDNQKRLWCTNVTGQFFYVENDSLHLDFDASKEIQSERLHAFDFYDDYLIVYTVNLLLKKNLITNTIKVLDKKDKKGRSFYYKNSVIKNDTLFFLKNINNENIVNYLTRETDVLQNYVLFNDAHFSQMYKYKNNLIYQQTRSKDGFKRILIEKNKITNLEGVSFKEFKEIYNFFTEKDAIWFLTEKGAEVFVEKNNYKIERKHHYFPKKFITEVVKDKQNNYWFSTLRNGVFVVPNIHMKTYDLQDDIGNITAIENVNNTHIYFGTTLGWLGIYDVKNNTTDYIKFDNKVSRVRHILYNNRLNDVYIATNSSTGSYIVDAKTKNIQQFEKGRYFGRAKSMVFLNDGRLFSSLIGKHTLLTFSKGKIETDALVHLRGKRVYKTHYDNLTETLFVANVDELVAYDKDFNSTIIRYKNQPIFARGITQTNDGTIWVSTFKDGVLAIKNNEVVKTYTTKNGLLSNQANYIQADENNVWITTENGLQYLNPQTNSFKNLTEKDGIGSFNINGIEIIGHTVWYSSNLGLFSFDKTKFKNRSVATPYFTSVTIADSTYAIQPNYTVGYNDKRIKISFNTNTFQSGKNIQYQYQLEGLNTNWQNITKGINEISFNSLEQGDYTFKLRTIEGDKTSEIKQIQLNVKGAFYKQWWFFLLIGLFLLTIIVYYYKQQLHKKDKEQKLAIEKQQNEIEKTFLKLENLRSQMNPHFVFNALNSIQDYILTNKKDLAGDYLGKFADLIRMYLDQSAKKEILLSEEIETLERYLELEKLRFEDKLQYTINIDKGIEEDKITIPTMLVQPYVENALKHGLLHKKTTGNLMIDFSLNSLKDYLVINVIDDGIGRKKSQEIKENQFRKHTSFATKANQDRLELLNYNRKNKIKVNIIDIGTGAENHNTGTKVTIQIPI